MKKYRLALLANENEKDHACWCKALENVSNVDYRIIDLSSSSWFNEIISQQFDYLLARPPGLTNRFKQLYDERIYILDKVLKLPVYPTPTEIYIYENKRFLYQWLKANSLPHPQTYIFYNKEEANDFAANYKLPLVAKNNIGASGSGVHILRTKKEKSNYIEAAFTTGAPRRWGPNLEKGGLLKRGLNYVKNPGEIKGKLEIYNKRRSDVQKGFVILQEYIEHQYEWRIVVIGDSFFAHKKLKIGDKSSGTTSKNYDNPPIHLFDFAKKLMDKYKFTSQAIDAFEQEDGTLLINELQCMFGQSDPYQMLVDGKPGRYKHVNNKWIFEKGDFTKNECFDLRVEHVLSLLNRQK